MLIPIEMPVRACVNQVNDRFYSALMPANETISQSPSATTAAPNRLDLWYNQ
jgi:hypothetical protein